MIAMFHCFNDSNGNDSYDQWQKCFSLDMFDLKVAPADEFQMKTRSVSIGSPFTGHHTVVTKPSKIQLFQWKIHIIWWSQQYQWSLVKAQLLQDLNQLWKIMNMRWVFLVIIIILIQIKITAMIIYVDILVIKVTSDEMASLMSSSYKGYSGI